jgi:membrane protein
MNRRWVQVLETTAREWSVHNVDRLSAALAFYAVFSLAPLLVIVLAVAAAFFGEQAVHGQVDNELEALMGREVAAALQGMVSTAISPQRSSLATVTGVAMLFFASTSLFTEMRHSLNVIWGVADHAQRGGILGWIWSRALAFAMVLVVLVLLLASLVFTGVFAFASTYAADRFFVPPWVWGGLGTGLALAGEIVLFALVFKILPDLRLPWGPIWTGAVVTALLFEAGKFGLGWYLSRGPVASIYGAAGSIVLFLLWVYYNAVIVLTGAEFTQPHPPLRRAGE